MQRVFITTEQMDGERIRVTGADAHHIRNVLRMRAGEHILACADDTWEYDCEIEEFCDDTVVLRVTDAQKPGKELPSRITLFQCLPKGDKMETVIQKAVELGASEIVPVSSSRCVVKLDAKRAAAKTQRWNAIAKAAAEQAKRMRIPPVREVMTFAEVLTTARASGAALLMPYEGAAGIDDTRRVLGGLAPGTDIAVLIGPEGGFSQEEAEAAAAAGFQLITLGKRILRTETAGMATLAILAYLLERE